MQDNAYDVQEHNEVNQCNDPFSCKLFENNLRQQEVELADWLKSDLEIGNGEWFLRVTWLLPA